MDAPPGLPVFELQGQGPSLRDMLMEAFVQSGILGPDGLATGAPGHESMDDIMTRIMDDYQPVSHPTARRVRAGLPRLRVRPADQKDPDEGEAAAAAGEPCSICHEAYGAGDEVVELPCDHCFHPDCVMPWLEAHNTCPVCRLELPAEEGGSAGVSQQQQQPQEQHGEGRAARPGGGIPPGTVAFQFPTVQVGALVASVSQALGELAQFHAGASPHLASMQAGAGAGTSAGTAAQRSRSDAGPRGTAAGAGGGLAVTSGARSQSHSGARSAAPRSSGRPEGPQNSWQEPPARPEGWAGAGAPSHAAGPARGRFGAAAGAGAAAAEQPPSMIAMVAGGLVAALAGTALGALLGSSRRSQR